MADNGLRSFTMHADDPEAAPALAALREERNQFPAFVSAAAPLAQEDPETAARRHLQQAIASSSLPGLTAPPMEGTSSEFRVLGTERVALTGTRTVKFRQTYHKIPIYGSLVTVELDDANELLALHSALGTPEGVNPVAGISAAEAVERVRTLAGCDRAAVPTPRLVYYFASDRGTWNLAYLLEDVEKRTPRSGEREGRSGGDVALLADYLIDAHTAGLIAELPRTPNVSSENGRVEIEAADEPGRPRTFTGIRFDGGIRLHDDALNVHTYDFRFGDVTAGPLPGTYVDNPPDWAPAAVSAHANAAEVARFLRTVLHRAGIDGQGGPLVSSVNCIVRSESPDNRQWANAAWYKNQMVYGQREVKGRLRSYAAGLDVVGHEVFHGVTSATARLQYVGETGALNESYSDIFGVIVSNYPRPVPEWDWRLGEDTEGTGIPLRDLGDPARHGQPDHMQGFLHWPPTRDNGGVHYNSGIHNKAAHLIVTARTEAGQPLFDPASAAALFYLALTHYLSRTSTFLDSRNAVVLVGRTLFRHDPPELRDARLLAIRSGFDQVGIH